MKVTHLVYEECNEGLDLLDKKEKLYERVTDKEELTYIHKNVAWERVNGKKCNINGRYIYTVYEGRNQSGTRLYYGVKKEGVGVRIYKPISRLSLIHI